MSLAEELLADLEELDNDEFESSGEEDDDEAMEGQQQQQDNGDVGMDGQGDEEDGGFVEPDFEALRSKDIAKVAKLYNGKGFQETLKVSLPRPLSLLMAAAAAAGGGG